MKKWFKEYLSFLKNNIRWKPVIILWVIMNLVSLLDYQTNDFFINTLLFNIGYILLILIGSIYIIDEHKIKKEEEKIRNKENNQIYLDFVEEKVEETGIEPDKIDKIIQEYKKIKFK